MRQRRKEKLKYALAAVAAIAFIVVGYSIAHKLEFSGTEARPVASPTASAEASAWGETVTVDGVKYRRRQNLNTYLIMGIDKNGEMTESSHYNYAGQADFQMLLVVDEAQKSYQLLHINRDTMTDVTMLGVAGQNLGTRVEQITLAFAYGNGGMTSAQNDVRAVENLLQNSVSIQHYLAMDLDGLPVLNDGVGGVPVFVEDDFSAIDPALVQGTTVTLMGNQAESFVRSRYNVDDGSNLSRMKRQRVYLSALLPRLQTLSKSDETQVLSLLDAISPYLLTDLKADEINVLLQQNEGFTARDMLTLPGEVDTSGTYAEFHVDKTALPQSILELFYAPA